ncbi:MAG: SDR family oxidoreductase [Bacteroidota bacterium]
MKILLTGSTGYIGKRLLRVLIEEGHQIYCAARAVDSFEWQKGWEEQVQVFKADFLNAATLEDLPTDFDVAFYLIHSMSSSINEFEKLEAEAALNFKNYLDRTSAQQIIYLSGMINQTELSKHLESRHKVEQILNESKVPVTTLRAGIVIGSGSASFEIIRDLVEKLPIMIAPKWLKTRCQPIAIRNVMQFLTGVMLHEATYNKNYDIGCSEVLTYKEMLLDYAEVRNLKRWILTVPVMTPRLSSYWLYFVTSTTYPLAVNLVNSMKIDVICRNDNLARLLGVELIPYRTAVQMAFAKIRQNVVVSSWKDSLVSSYNLESISDYVRLPRYGCFTDKKQLPITNNSPEQVWKNIEAIGGERGWYYGSWLWKIRGYLDKMTGGIGLRRGRTHPAYIHAGDALDFWRVLVSDRENKRLLLFAEMKLPGEAWLEFKIENDEQGTPVIHQTATFRPQGLLGRLYWYAVLPFHFFVFNGMIRNLERYQAKPNIESKRTNKVESA